MKSGAGIPLDLHFDGVALEPTATPEFTCYSAKAAGWVSCGVRRGDGPGAWVLEGLEPGDVVALADTTQWAGKDRLVID